MPRTGIPVSVDVYRPFGDSTPLHTGVAGVLYDDLTCGLGVGLSGTLSWTNFIDVAISADIIDNCTRSGGSDGLLYSDGDGIAVPAFGTLLYCVVLVQRFRDLDTGTDYKRVYLIRDTG
jgi:hypothetical protein